jgi:hypothetical protein
VIQWARLLLTRGHRSAARDALSPPYPYGVGWERRALALEALSNRGGSLASSHRRLSWRIDRRFAPIDVYPLTS